MAIPAGAPSGSGAGTGNGDVPGTGTTETVPGGAGTGSPPPAGAGAPGVIPLTVLPEELRGQSEEAIKYQLSQLLTSLRTSNTRNQELERELRARRAEPPPPPPVVEAPKIPVGADGQPKKFGDWLLEEPEKALDHFFGERAKGVLGQMQQLAHRVDKTEFSSVRAKVPDFARYEESITGILGDAERTEENVMGAYAMAKGLEAIENETRAQRGATSTERAAPPEGEAPRKDYPKTSLSEEIRQGMGMGEEEYYDKFAKADYFPVKVPS
jgi:hypothetical protein